jgi:hypothetical protein
MAALESATVTGSTAVGASAFTLGSEIFIA